MGRDVVVGYGSVLVPTIAGRHERMVHMYAPQPSSLLQRFRSWVSGAYPEVSITDTRSVPFAKLKIPEKFAQTDVSGATRRYVTSI